MKKQTVADPSVLELYVLSLVDRGLRSKYELQRHGGVSLGSSSPALNRLRAAGLITDQAARDGTKRVRNMLTLTSAGRRVARRGCRQYLDTDANLDIEAILRIFDIARHSGVTKREMAEFLEAMASVRGARSRETDTDGNHRIIDLQRQWSIARAKSEAAFLSDLVKRYKQSKPSPATKRAGTKMRSRR